MHSRLLSVRSRSRRPIRRHCGSEPVNRIFAAAAATLVSASTRSLMPTPTQYFLDLLIRTHRITTFSPGELLVALLPTRLIRIFYLLLPRAELPVSAQTRPALLCPTRGCTARPMLFQIIQHF